VNIETSINVFDDTQYEKIIFDLFKAHQDIDGIFASSDVMAAYAIKVCHTFGRKVPEDVKIIGYDDINIASLMMPSITTINQPIDEMGELAVELIIKQIEGKKVPTKNIFPVTLVKRETA
ncbi:MAG: substrate-binding domain-containing protein, partial [Caldicoprobacterales bacterium]